MALILVTSFIEWPQSSQFLWRLKKINDKNSCDVIIEGFDRRRRTPFFYANPRFWKTQRLYEDEDNDLDDDEEGIEARGFC